MIKVETILIVLTNLWSLPVEDRQLLSQDCCNDITRTKTLQSGWKTETSTPSITYQNLFNMYKVSDMTVQIRIEKILPKSIMSCYSNPNKPNPVQRIDPPAFFMQVLKLSLRQLSKMWKQMRKESSALGYWRFTKTVDDYISKISSSWRSRKFECQKPLQKRLKSHHLNAGQRGAVTIAANMLIGVAPCLSWVKGFVSLVDSVVWYWREPSCESVINKY